MSTPSTPLCVMHILVPDVVHETVVIRSQDEILTHNSEKEDYIEELLNLARVLHFSPCLHALSLSNMADKLSKIPVSELILNVCDGSDIDGVPGPSVSAYLESHHYSAVVGCDTNFINNTLTKNGMKLLFQEALVATPPGFGATISTDIQEEIELNKMIYPLFVKISDSYGSVGLDDSSVCHDYESLITKCKHLFEQFENLTIEEYVDGQEFSVLVSGNCRDESWPVIVYPPAERAFNPDLSQYQRFISFSRNWDESALAHHYASVQDTTDAAALQDLARRAYVAVSGNCYGRVDIRKRDVNGKFYVLEVNASCGLGKGSSSEFILNLAGQKTLDFFKILLTSALKTESVEKSSPSTPVLFSASYQAQIKRLITHPSLSCVPSPVIHVIVGALLMESKIPDPEGKLSHTWGKDAEYVSEIENILRTFGYDPIVHLHPVDWINEPLANLSLEDDLILNACFGQDGLDVALMIGQQGFKKTVGLNAQFFKESQSRMWMRTLLKDKLIPVPNAIEISHSDLKSLDMTFKLIMSRLHDASIMFPVYMKPSIAMRQHEGEHKGCKLTDADEFKLFLESIDLETQSSWMVEEFLEGIEYRVLVAGNARDQNADLIVLPPVVLQNEFESHHYGKYPRVRGEKESDKVVTQFYRAMTSNELMLKMDIQDLARRSFVAVHGSCYGFVSLLLRTHGYLTVLGVSGDVRFGENSKADHVLRLSGLGVDDLLGWLLDRPVEP